MSVVVRDGPRGRRCACDLLFEGFRWVDLAGAPARVLPEAPGVYVIRLVVGGDAEVARSLVRRAYDELMGLLGRVGWRELEAYWGSRAQRLLEVDPAVCPVVYIGSTGSLRERFRDLAGRRHTVFCCVMALRLAGLDLDWGFKVLEGPDAARVMEARLLDGYAGLHGRLPPLNENA